MKYEFRGKVADEPDEWVIGYLSNDRMIYQPQEGPHNKCCGHGTFFVHPETVSPYIGHNDKNGKHIYVNDILKVYVRRCGGSAGNWYKDTNVNHGFVGDYIYVKVVYKDGDAWHNNRFGYYYWESLPITKRQIKEIEKPRGRETEKQQVDTRFELKDSEVIGNIFDNPELLD